MTLFAPEPGEATAFGAAAFAPEPGEYDEVVRVGIIGAGAAGMTAAYYLQKLFTESKSSKRLKITMLEARDRIGGRILTTDTDGNSLIQGANFTGKRANAADKSQCNVLEFGAQWAHDVADEDHALQPFVRPVGMLLSEPEMYTFAQDTNTLTFTHKDFPSVSNRDQAELDLWMEDIVADTVLRYDIFYNHGDKIFTHKGEHFKNTFPSATNGGVGASVEEIVDMALSKENIDRWWSRKRNGKVHSGPVTPRGRDGSNAEDRSFAEDFAELDMLPEMPTPGRMKRLMSLPEHYQEEETDDFNVSYPSAPLLRLARRLLLITFSSYYGLDPRNIGYASLESQIEHSEEHRVVRNGYARLISHLAEQCKLRDGDADAKALADASEDAAAPEVVVYMNRSVTSITESADGIRVACVTGGQGKWNLSDHFLPTPADAVVENQEYSFDHVVCTLPLGVLKKLCPPKPEPPSEAEGTANDDGDGDGDAVVRGESAAAPAFPSFFTPALPQSIANSISRLEMGLLNKLVVLWDDAEEWERVNLPRRFVFPGDHDKTFCMIINLNSDTMHSSDLRGYCMYSAPPFSELVEKMDQETLVNMAMDIIATGKQELLRRDSKKLSAKGSRSLIPVREPTQMQAGGIRPPPALAADEKVAAPEAPLPRPNRVFTTHWMQDPYSLGAYSCMPKGGSLADFDAFATPHGHVHFAGEHAQSSDFGCVHAAIETGKRAATAIIGGMTPRFF